MAMKKLFSFILILVFSVPLLAQGVNSSSPETILIFVRHAEKTDDGTNNPSLNQKGKERADQLATLLIKDYDIQAIYSTPYKRTLETSKPLANQLKLIIQEYGLSKPARLIHSIIENHRGETVLVTGHSNTTPHLVNLALGQSKYPQLEEHDYGYIFVVKIGETGEIWDQRFSY